MDGDRRFPGWSGPAAGALFGALLAAFAYWRNAAGQSIGSMLLYIALPLAGGCVVSLIDWMEHKPGPSAPPSATLTKLILAAVPFVFWIPVLGLIVASVGLYRTRWLAIPEWCAFVLCCLFYLSVGVTFVAALILAIEQLGMR